MIGTKNYAETLSANYGGTEMYAPLAWILHRPLIEGYARQVFNLTDGEVSLLVSLHWNFVLIVAISRSPMLTKL